jgi:hypothetical protein
MEFMEYELPKFVLRRDFKIGEQRTTDTYEGDMPQEVYDQLAPLLGNAQARVAVGTTMAIKDFGNGPDVHVSVSLSCNQDAQTVAAAANIAGQWARHFVKEQLVIAKQEYDQLAAQLDPKKAAQQHIPAGPPAWKPG